MTFLFDSVKKFNGQDYHGLKKEAKKKGVLFMDPEFPPDDRSLSSTPGKFGNVVWKRPKQICDDPRLFVDGASAGDVIQGRLGNCWFVAACSCLASVKEIWNKVIPDIKSQEWDPEKVDNYRGIFRFQFWRFGEWTEVVIDDMLPTINEELVFIHSQSRNEFWSALLEKAYAKLFGNYEALAGGELSEALEDFTGGVANTLDLVKMEASEKVEERVALFARLQKEIDRNSLMAASIPPTSAEESEAVTETGLVKGHAYGITAVKNVHFEGSGLFRFFNREKLPMIRLRNPWGKCEWKGAFSDGSPEWQKITKSDRQKIGLTFEEKGEFWMTFEDFCKNFHLTSICRVVNTSLFSLKKTWSEGMVHGAWRAPGRAGGCPDYIDTFLKNPQYSFDVDDEDEFMIQLMQKSRRDKDAGANKSIGFIVLKVELNRRYRLHDANLQETITSSVFRDSRSIFLRYGPVKKGRYVVIPSTFEPNQEAPFLLRVYTSASNNFTELTQEAPKKSCWSCCGRKHSLVTQIKIIRASGLEKQDSHGASPYCVITCEGEKVTTPVISNTVNPEWGASAVFYRKRPIKKPIKIQVWNSNVLRDKSLGKHVFMATEDLYHKALEVGLSGRKKESATVRPGKLTFQVTQSRHLTTV